MARITAADFTAIQTRVKAELTRRNGNGDLSSYAGSATDYPVNEPVATDGLVRPSAVNKLLAGLRYINSSGVPADVSTGDKILETTLPAITNRLATFEAQPRNATSGNDCASACSGMCVSQCTTTCSTTCTGGCQETCTGGCNTTCTGGCASTCSTTCTGSCSGSCSGGCSGDCYTECTGCKGGCTGQCVNLCKGGCKGTCGGSCTGTCTQTCGDNCSGDCTKITG